MWNSDFFNAIQQYDWSAFRYQFMVFGVIAVAAIVVTVYQVYLQQMLQIRWRRWMTQHYLDVWLDERAYYRLQLEHGATDNPDQRISEDLDRFTRRPCAHHRRCGFLNARSSRWSRSSAFSGRCPAPRRSRWAAGAGHHPRLHGVVRADLRRRRHLAHLQDRPAAGARSISTQQRYEADFRFSLVRLRENTESIALYGGEGRERRSFIDRFAQRRRQFLEHHEAA